VRGIWLLVVAVLGSVGVGVGIEAGSVATGPKPTFKAAALSIGASPYLEMAFTATVPVPGMTGEEISTGEVDVQLESADGHTALSNLSAGFAANVEVSLFEQHHDLADIRVLGGKEVFVRVFPGQIAKLPSIPAADRQKLELASGLFGGQWFSLPKSLLGALGRSSRALPPARVTLPSKSDAQAVAKRFENDLLAATSFSSRSVPSGTATSAVISLHELVTITERDLVAMIGRSIGVGRLPLGGASAKADHTNGTVTFTVVTGSASSTMRTASLAINSGGESGSIDATITHDPLNLNVPAGSRALPAGILGQLGRLGPGAIG
jgi:hypothetical protein